MFEKDNFFFLFLFSSSLFVSCHCEGIDKYKLNIINISPYAEGFLHFVSYTYCPNIGPNIKLTYRDNNGTKKNICTFSPPYNTWTNGLYLEAEDQNDLLKSLNVEYPNADGGSFVVQRQDVSYMLSEEWELQLNFYSLKCFYANLIILPNSMKIDTDRCRVEVNGLLRARFWRDNNQLMEVECSNCS